MGPRLALVTTWLRRQSFVAPAPPLLLPAKGKVPAPKRSTLYGNPRQNVSACRFTERLGRGFSSPTV